ncbi:hypothetical protein Bca52824_049802 [Brassica carinata]|uniref:Uncharacterized protein n=1 Tax=Brassica carinata TaxID=52824 RepID=A0A8X7RJ94_BRACI|nr:hypothetical protein Bca52824_049802 [Brassica carinata]
MHHALHTDNVLHPGSYVEGEISSGPASSPSDVAESGAVGDHTVHTFEEVVDSIFGFGREELEGEGCFAFVG